MKEDALNIDKDKTATDKKAAEDAKDKPAQDATKDRATFDQSQSMNGADKEEFKADPTDKAKDDQGAAEE